MGGIMHDLARVGIMREESCNTCSDVESLGGPHTCKVISKNGDLLARGWSGACWQKVHEVLGAPREKIVSIALPVKAS